MFPQHFAYQFPGIGAIFILAGFIASFRLDKRWWILLLGIVLINTLYALNFHSSDIYVFHVPAYLVAAIWLGIGLDAASKRIEDGILKTAFYLGGFLIVILPLFIYSFQCQCFLNGSLVDDPVASHLGEVSYPFQKPIHDSRGAP